MRGLRLAFVLPRFPEPGFAGGAETLVAALAQRLHARGHRVECLTTCARDHFTWENYHRPGRTEHHGMPVIRFPVDGDRDLERYVTLDRQMQIAGGLPPAAEEEWLANSLHSEPLYEYLAARAADLDAAVFAPYLFGLSNEGPRRIPRGKAVLLPCLHDEVYARLRVIAETFRAAGAFLFNAPAEMRLAERLFGIDPRRGVVVGMGFDPVAASPARFRDTFGIAGPFALYAGRREGGKNTPLLIDYFTAWKERHRGSDLRLVLMGSGGVALPPEAADEVIDLGYVKEQEKLDGMAACTFFCQPSYRESFSIVLMEAWLAGRPALVHRRCEVAVEHCRLAAGGLFFADYPEFEACVELLLADPQAAQRLGAAGGEYVRREYSWQAVIARLEEGLTRIVS